jgi:hypothetical protein
MQTTKSMFIFGLLVCLSSCGFKKPFQPHPPIYQQWFKLNLTEEDIKQTMRDCGYKNLYGYGGPVTTNEEDARLENCMFANGLRYKDGYKGICSLKKGASIAACKDYTNPNLRP